MKVKLHKIEMYVTDFDCYGGDYILECIENVTGFSPDCPTIKTVEIEWDDDIDINYSNVTKEDYEKYFE